MVFKFVVCSVLIVGAQPFYWRAGLAVPGPSVAHIWHGYDKHHLVRRGVGWVREADQSQHRPALELDLIPWKGKGMAWP